MRRALRCALSIALVLPAACGDRRAPRSPDPPSRPAAVLADAGVDAPADAGDLTPAWSHGSLRDRLLALRVDDGTWARRTVFTWTTQKQIDALAASRVLLVARESTRGPPSPFIFALDDLSRRPGEVGAIAKLLLAPPFDRRRYAWTAAYATVLGLSGRRYGEQLIAIELRDDSWIVEVAPDAEPPMRIRDLALVEISLADARKDPSRIAAVYHLRTGKDVPFRFREHIVVNEQQVRRWSVGTPELHAEIDAERALLIDLRTALQTTRVGPSLGRSLQAWQHVDPDSTLRALWLATLAFDNDRYKLDLPRLAAVIDGLATYDRTTPAIDVVK